MIMYREDKFGTQHNVRHYLLLDTVRVSNSRLLQLPAEILADVVDALSDDAEALASLALVNSDCRQLARCAQFAEITFDYSIGKRKLFQHLLRDAAGGPDQLGIGRCVRRVIINSKPSRVQEMHPDVYEAFFGQHAETTPQEERQAVLSEANTHYCAQVRTLISWAVALGMPNVQVLVWKDGFAIDEDSFMPLFTSPAQHVKLKRLIILDMSGWKQPLTVKTWPLRSLSIDFAPFDRWMNYQPKRHRQSGQDVQIDQSDYSAFFIKIFQLCAPTLESLCWSLRWYPGLKASFGSSRIVFPRLQRLRLYIVNLDAVTLSSFLAAPLRHLELPPSDLGHYARALASCETLRDLASFVVPGLPKQKEMCMHIAHFLARHTHLEKLYLHEESIVQSEEAHLDRCIMPALAKNRFDHLRSLSLAWGGVRQNTDEPVLISDTALAIVGTLTSLEQLYLRCGYYGRIRRQSQWLVDHTQLQHHLRGLQRLQFLALDCDTYLNEEEPRFGRYYDDCMIAVTDFMEAEERPELDMDTDAQTAGQNSTGLTIRARRTQIWNRAHRNRMLKHMEAYAAILPALERMYCGDWTATIERDPHKPTGPCKAVPVSTVRGKYPSNFEAIFGIYVAGD